MARVVIDTDVASAIQEGRTPGWVAQAIFGREVRLTLPAGRLGARRALGMKPGTTWGPHEGHERYRMPTNDNNVFPLLRG